MDSHQLREAAEAATATAPAAMGIQPAPVPTAVGVAQVKHPDGSLGVALQFSTPVGTAFFFLPTELAAKIAHQLDAVCRAAGAGLVLPNT